MSLANYVTCECGCGGSWATGCLRISEPVRCWKCSLHGEDGFMHSQGKLLTMKCCRCGEVSPDRTKMRRFLQITDDTLPSVLSSDRNIAHA